MGSVGVQAQKVSSSQSQIRQEDIKGVSFIFGTAVIRPDSIDIDGYSNKKTIKGALSDLAKALDKYDKGEADALRSSIKFNEIEQMHPDRYFNGAQYILEYEEVPSAVKYNDNDTVEYKDAKWYLHTRIIRRS